MECSPSSSMTDPVESMQSKDVLSPEDVAWADSCLVKDCEIPATNWDSIIDVLVEIRTSQPESFEFSAKGRLSLPGNTKVEILPPGEDKQTPPVLGKTLSDEQVEQNGDDNVFTLKKIDELKSPFLPSYNEDIKESKNADDPSLSALLEEPSSEGIFRVWDLDIPEEEDELFKQFNEALAVSSLQPLLLIPDNSAEWKDLKDKSIDNLVAGISDLSLGQDSG